MVMQLCCYWEPEHLHDDRGNSRSRSAKPFTREADGDHAHDHGRALGAHVANGESYAPTTMATSDATATVAALLMPMRVCCRYCLPSRETLQCAKQNLDGMAVVGIQEHFQRTLALLQHQLGLWPIKYMNASFVANARPPNPARPGPAAMGNTTASGLPKRRPMFARHPDVPLKLLRRFAQRSDLDQELYAHALKLFHAQWQGLAQAS